jgi:hypothetical protein
MPLEEVVSYKPTKLEDEKEREDVKDKKSRQQMDTTVVRARTSS